MERKGKNITYASRHMSTLWNPFSYKNTEPKYPDGLAQYSIGQKYTNHFVVTGEEITVLLFPGLVGSAIAWTNEIPDKQNTSVDNDEPWDGRLLPLANDAWVSTGTWIQGISLHADEGNLFSLQGIALEQLANDNNDPASGTSLDPTNKFSSWRPVSTAFKIQPISNHKAIECGRDGWWEAVRINGAINDHEWGVHGFFQENIAEPEKTLEPTTENASRAFGGPYDSLAERRDWGGNTDHEPIKWRAAPKFLNGKGFIQPTKNTFDSFATSDNWTLQPSYTKGCIRDLSCWTFQLNNSKRDNEFIDIRPVSIAHTNNASDYRAEKQPFAFRHDLLYPQTPSEQHRNTWDYWYYQGTTASVPRNGIHYEDTHQRQDNIPANPGLPDDMYQTSHLQRIEGFECLYSDAFDVIVLKIHGRPGTHYLIHTVANIEYLANNDTDLQEYTTTSYAALDELSHFLDVRANDHPFPNHNYFREKLKF